MIESRTELHYKKFNIKINLNRYMSVPKMKITIFGKTNT